MIRFPPFEPDRASYSAEASPLVVNGLPVVDGWGPLPQFVPISQALPAEPRGAVYARDNAGAFRIFVGTETGLYQLDTSDYSWEDVSGSSAPFSLPVGDNWSFKQFGSTLVATQIGDPPQYIDVDSGTEFADLPGNPPQAKYVDSAGDFLILAHLNGDPLGVRTSALGDAGFWTTGLRLSGDQTLPDGEEIQGLYGGETGCYIFQRRKIRLLSITQNVDVPFAIQVVNASRGVISPRSIAGVGPNLLGYLSSDGFSLGIEGRPIGGERIDRWFNRTIDPNALADVVGAADPYNKIVWWQATMTNTERFMVGYNWQLDRWCYSDQNTSTLVDLVTPAVSWGGIDQFFADWQAANVPWGARILTGGLPTFAGFDSTFRLGFFSGGNMAATLQTGDLQLTQGRRTFVNGCRLVGDPLDYTIKIGASDRYGVAPVLGTGVAPYAGTGVTHFRSSGLLHRFSADIPAGEVWSHVSGLVADGTPEGRR